MLARRSTHLGNLVVNTENCAPKRERRNQAYGNEVLLAAAEREEQGAQDREDTRHSQSRRFDDETYGWETFGDVVQAPKLTIDTEYISRASRALAAVTLVKRATASERAVHSGAMQETWIDGYRADGWTVTGWMLVGIVTCCILMSLVLL